MFNVIFRNLVSPAVLACIVFAGANAARLSFLEGEAAFVPRFVEGRPGIGQRRTPFPTNEIELCIEIGRASCRERV